MQLPRGQQPRECADDIPLDGALYRPASALLYRAFRAATATARHSLSQSRQTFAAGLGFNEIRVGEGQFCIQTQFLEEKRVSQGRGSRIFGKWRDSGQRDKPKSLLGEGVLRRAHLWTARVVPALSDRISAEKSDVLA